MTNTHIRVAAAAVLLLTAAACREIFAPRDEPYALKSIGGVALPAPYAQNPNHAGRILSGSLALGQNGRGSWTLSYEESPGGSRYSSSQGFSYTQQGNTVTIHLDCDDTASCIAGPHLIGTLGDRRITFQTSNVMRVPLVYEATP